MRQSLTSALAVAALSLAAGAARDTDIAGIAAADERFPHSWPLLSPQALCRR